MSDAPAVVGVASTEPTTASAGGEATGKGQAEGKEPGQTAAYPTNTETPKEPQPQANEEQKRMSKAFASIARQEKALRERESTYKQQLAERDGRLARLEAIEKGLLSGNPIDALAKMGLDFNELSKRALSGGKPSSEHVLTEQEKRIKSLEDEREKAREDAKRSHEEANAAKAVESFRAQIDVVLKKDDRFELTKLHGGVDDVYGVIDEHYARHGEILDIEDAAQLVEQYYAALVEKSLASAKYKGRLAPAKAEPAEEPTASGGRESSPPRTLSNQLAADTPARRKAPMTREQRAAAAARVFEEASKR